MIFQKIFIERFGIRTEILMKGTVALLRPPGNQLRGTNKMGLTPKMDKKLRRYK
jgi:hypothetical protein